MRLSDFAIRNPVKITVGVILLCMYGLLALFHVPVQLTPEVSRPVINIETLWPFATPDEIETEIVEKQEEELKGIKGMTEFKSECQDGRGRIDMEFALGTNMQETLVEVISALQQVRDYPPDAGSPRVQTVNVDDSPIAWFSLLPSPPAWAEAERLLADHPGNQALREALQPARRGDEAHLATLHGLRHKHPELKLLLDYRQDPTDLRNFAMNVLESAYERVDGVANSEVMGGRVQRLEVVIRPADLAKRRLSITDLRDKLAEANQDTSGGQIDQGKSKHKIITKGKFTSVEQVENVQIAVRDGAPVFVKDVGSVRLGYARPEGFVRHLGMPALSMNVQKEPDANVLEVMDRVKQRTEELNNGVLKSMGLRLEQTFDQTTYITSARDLVESNIYLGGALAILVLLFFLRDWRSTLVIALSIPISVVGTFLVVRMLGRSVNVISLAGMAFAVGMVVDNAIVVLENIYTRYQRGESPRTAASRGTSEVWGAVLASTLTTLAVFIPVVFVEEQAGQLFKDIAIAISAAVGLSLVVSLTVVPTAAARLLKERRPAEDEVQSGAKRRGEKKFLWFAFGIGQKQPASGGDVASTNGECSYHLEGNASLLPAAAVDAPRDPWFTRVVTRMTEALQAGRISTRVRIVLCVVFFVGLLGVLPATQHHLPPWPYLVPIPRPMWLLAAMLVAAAFVPLALRAPRLAFAAAIMVLAVGLSFRLLPGTEYLPQGNRNLIVARLQPPPGYNQTKLTALAEQVESRLRKYWEAVGDEAATAQLDGPAIDSIFIGSRGDGLFVGARSADPLRAHELVDVLRKATSGFPGVTTSVGQSSLFERGLSGGRTIDIEISGDDTQKLIRLGGFVRSEVERIYPADATKTSIRTEPSLEQSSPELHVRIDRVKAAQRGVNATDLGYTLSALVDGAFSGDYWHEGDKINLVIAAPPEMSLRVDALEQFPIMAPASGEIVPLAAVAEVSHTGAADRIVRIDRQRAVTIQVRPGDAIALEEATQRINDEIIAPLRASGELEGGRYNVNLGGTADELRQMLAALGGGLLLAVIITYLLVSGLYESFIFPLVIMVAVPMGAVGGIIGLQVLNLFALQKLDTLTMLGFVILIGTTVNNAILIVDQALINIRDYGMDHRTAVTDSTRGRVRPILMTTLTTVLGMLPLVLFPGAGSELYRGLGAVILGGLIFSTIFVIVLVPMLFSLVYEGLAVIRRRFSPAGTLAQLPAEEPIIEPIAPEWETEEVGGTR